MAVTPHIDADSPDFPGDSTPQPPFGLRDSLRSIALWPVGLSQLVAWSTAFRIASRFVDLTDVDLPYKWMSRMIPASCGIKVDIVGKEHLDPGTPKVYVSNHVNIFDIFVIYQSIPGCARALEHVEHFSWPLIGPILRTAGQIPVDPTDATKTARGIRRAKELLEQGISIAVLPEGQRTLDGSVGHFHPGAFRLAIRAATDIVPLAIRGGRQVARRGDWRIRPGKIEVLVGEPIPTSGLRIGDADALAERCRSEIIALLRQGS